MKKPRNGEEIYSCHPDRSRSASDGAVEGPRAPDDRAGRTNFAGAAPNSRPTL